MATVSDHHGVQRDHEGGGLVAVAGTLHATPVDHEQNDLFLTPPRTNNNTPSDHAHDEANLTHQKLWDDAIIRNMGVQDGYNRVGVLMIQWEDAMDDLGVADEVKRLDAVFQNKYNFETEHFRLHSRRKSQNQMHVKLAQFVENYDEDDSRNLIIVYYTGHGSFQPQEKLFYLEAENRGPELLPGGKRPCVPEVCWNTAEPILMASDTDVLVIFDSCNAARLMQKSSSRDDKAYEILCASAPDRPTEAPGLTSFTEALIAALETLLDESPSKSFTTELMTQWIAVKRHDNIPVRWNKRRREEAPIRLAPVPPKSSPTVPNSSWRPPHPDASFLTLKFHINKRQLDYNEVNALTDYIPKAFKNAKVHCDRIGFVNLEPRRQPRHDSHRLRDAVIKVSRLQSTSRRWSQRNGTAQEPVQASGNALQRSVSATAGCGPQIDENACLSPDPKSPSRAKTRTTN